MIKKFLVYMFLFTGLLFPAGSYAKLDIVTTNPDLESIVKEIGKDMVNVRSLGKGYQNPHFVDPKPNFIIYLNKADILFYTGLDQEIGWLPPLLTSARNSKIATEAASGNIDCSRFIDNLLEVPDKPVDRSMGDIHAGGNPHYLLNPRNGLKVARGIYSVMAQADPVNKSDYEVNYLKFAKKLSRKIIEWEKKLEAYKGSKFITYHRTWTYFFDWAGFTLVNTIEPIPGIPPSPSHVAEVLKDAREKNVDIVISSNYYPEKTSKIVAEKSGKPFIPLPAMVEGNGDAGDYISLFDFLIKQITSKLDT